MKRHIYFVVLTFLIPLFSVQAQENIIRCWTTEYMEMLVQQNPELGSILENNEQLIQNYINSNPEALSSETVTVIPVVVHVIWNTAQQNIPDSMIHSQIRVLNEDFRRMEGTNGHNSHPDGADSKFEFRLADRDPNGVPHTGINRVFTTVTAWNPSTQNAQLKALSYWPSQNFLNIWVANLSGGILGYAQFPGGPAATDGVVILWRAFGYNSPISLYNLGRTATHEVGHWLNLRHIWGDVNTCNGTDFCDDTPPCSGQYFSNPPNCPVPVQCGFPRQIENYMDYSGDGCMNLFTNCQSARMKSAYNVFRPALWVSYKETIEVTATGVDYNFTTPSNANYATLNFSSLGTADEVTVEVFPNLYPLDIPPGSKAVKRYFDITAEGMGYDATFTAYYNDSEVINFINGDSNLKLWRFDGSNWVLKGGTVDPVANTVTLPGVNEFSLWALSDPDDNPIPVELTSFESYVDANTVTLSWTTATEINNHGFEIERTKVIDDKYNEWENISFIQGNGTTTRSSYYSYIDTKVQPGTYLYRLKQIDNDGSFEYKGIVNAEVHPPINYSLFPNYPNPFNPSTMIKFQLPEKQLVSLKVFDALGVEVAVLVNQEKEAGIYEVTFDASSLPSGVYYYMLKAGGFIKTNKMLLLK